MKKTEELRKKAVALPEKPGVYIMKNDASEIIYIGKAKNLKNRVSQYFQDTASHSPKTRMMVSKIHDFDIIEDIDKGFVKEYLGTFAKSNNSDATFTGHEVIWTRYDGSPESVAYLGVKEGDVTWKSWQRKKETRDRWLFIKEEISNRTVLGGSA